MKLFLLRKQRKGKRKKSFFDSSQLMPMPPIDKHRYEHVNPYLAKILKLKATIPEWDDDEFFTSDEETRGSNWVRLEVVGQRLLERYAWAIPDARALKILQHYSPLIEIGAGRGYWSRLLSDMDNVDIVAFDRTVYDRRWFDVQRGGPEVLSRSIADERSLFLCYPDESNNLGLKCLRRYRGEVIVHVGELVTTGTLSGYPQAPFGRTTSSEFTVELLESFHCILSASIPRFPFSKDCITVWKRTMFVEGRRDEQQPPPPPLAAPRNTGHDGNNWWVSIPADEQLPEERAAPCVQHLLLLS